MQAQFTDRCKHVYFGEPRLAGPDRRLQQLVPLVLVPQVIFLIKQPYPLSPKSQYKP